MHIEYKFISSVILQLKWQPYTLWSNIILMQEIVTNKK